ncbi:MAG: T9SS type A sorting domain-containing protein [Ferruginibacter sp.]
MHPQFRTTLFYVACLLSFSELKAQTEYIVEVNPSTAAITKVDSIPGVTWLVGFNYPSYCESNHHFSFIGGDDPTGNPFYLFTVDAITGQTISNPLFPDHPYFHCLQYSRSGNTLYGIKNNIGSDYVSLFVINPTTGIYSLLKDYPGISTIIKLIVDDTNNRIFMYGVAGGIRTLLTVDITNGNIITQAGLDDVVDLVYNYLTDKVYGLAIHDPVTPQTYPIYALCTIDINSGALNNINEIPNLLQPNSGYETLDVNGGRYFFISNNTIDTALQLYTINITNGNIISKVPVHEGGGIDRDNLIEFRYDNNLNKLYALFWEAVTYISPPAHPDPVIIDSSCRLDLQTKIYPNNFSHSLIVEKNPTICKVTMNIYNMIGQVMLKGKMINDSHNEIPLTNYSMGTYFYEFISNGKIILKGRFFKQ